MWFKVIDMIEKLEKRIMSLDSEIAHLDSRIDTLECYKRNTEELDELVQRSNELEEQKRKLLADQEAYVKMIMEHIFVNSYFCRIVSKTILYKFFFHIQYILYTI